MDNIVDNVQNHDISLNNFDNIQGRHKMSKVNLDALIPRADFLDTGGESTLRSLPTGGFSILDLEQGKQILSLLRKPDFQRETNEWEPEKVCGLIDSYVNSDLIPSVILWYSPKSGYTFVIDGSHRLSALIAWVNDDYGDKEISRNFYRSITSEQEKIAEKTRKLIKTKIGDYRDYVNAVKTPQGARQEILANANTLFFRKIEVQWLPSTDAISAENSFLKINKLAAPVNSTELKLIECRNKPNGITARAISKAGAGHPYWDKFEDSKKEAIISLAKEINGLLFKPPIESGATKTTELPIGGKLHSTQTLPLIFDLVSITNKIEFKKQKGDGKDKIFKIESDQEIQDDTTGEDTISYLKIVKKYIQKISSQDVSSLGLYPALYFYSFGGKHKVASFYAIVALIMDFENKKYYKKFLDIREKFEEFLMDYDILVQQIVRKYRSASNGYVKIKDFYWFIIELLASGIENKDLGKKIINNSEYNYLELTKRKGEKTNKEFSTERKSEIYLREAIKLAPKCPLCKGYYIGRSTTIDHIKNKKNGGLGTKDNAQITHPYCNSIKN